MTRPAAIKPLSANAKVRLALVSGSGFGKTVLCGTAPRALFLTTDPEGTISAQRFGSTAQEWSINSWNDKDGLEDAYRWMAEEGHKEFDWMIHDNATEEQQLMMGESIDVRLKTRPDGSKYVPERNDYFYSQNGFIDFTKRCMTIPVHQIWTVHRKLMTGVDDNDDSIDFWSANIQGQNGAIAEQFLGYMNIIGMGEVVKKEDKAVRRLYFSHTRQYRGKDRFNRLGNFKDDLTIPKMMELIEGTSVSGNVRPPTRRRRVATTK